MSSSFKVLLSPEIPEGEIWASSSDFERLKDRIMPEFEQLLNAAQEAQALADKLYGESDFNAQVRIEFSARAER